MKKRTISLLLVLCFVLSLLPGAVFADGTGKAIQLAESGAAANIAGAQESSVWFGTYQQSDDGAGGYSVDPVKWRVLSNAGGRLFLLSDQILDAAAYHTVDTSTYITWDTSTIRSWLNGYEGAENQAGTDYSAASFLGTAFTGGEQAAIPEVTIDNVSKNPYYGKDVTDKVFLLSLAEATTTAYGFTNNYSETDVRAASYTDYTKSRGIDTYSGTGRARWWLRSPGKSSGYDAAVVDEDGSINSDGYDIAIDDIGVRPAFHIDLNSVLFTSAAEGGKAPEPLGVGDWCEVVNYTGSDWKLTLLDADRKFAVTETSVTAASLDTVELDYTGAATGENEYISALLADSKGNLLYYGRLNKPENADGKVYVHVPVLDDGSYTLKLFSEQYNGDYKTDYASAFSDVALTVGKPADPDLTLDFGEYECSRGDSVNVNVKLAEGDVPISGMRVVYQIDSPLTITGFGGSAAAYHATVDKNEEKLEQNFFAVGSDGEPVLGEVGESVFKCKVSVPADCPAGDYTITFKSVEAYTNGQQTETCSVRVLPGKITVKKPAGPTLSGDGSPENPYRIGSAQDLLAFAQKVNGGDYGAWAVLTAEKIDLGNVDWTPIGDYAHPYTGRFDGNGGTITGLNVTETDSCGNAGFFGYVGGDGGVENLTLSGSVYVCYLNGILCVGGVVGRNAGTIRDCAWTGPVTVDANGDSNGYVGGVVGRNEGAVSRCSAEGDVTAMGQSGNSVYVGGVAGLNGYLSTNGTVEDCWSSGAVTLVYTGSGGTRVVCAGGVVGENEAGSDTVIRRCYHFSGAVDIQIEDTTSASYYHGGVVGCNYNENANAVAACYYLDGTAKQAVGAGGGEQNTTKLTADQFMETDSFAGWDFCTTWYMGEEKPEFTRLLPTAEVDTWGKLITALQGSGIVVLTQSITCNDQTRGYLEVPANTTVILDLNGYTLDRGLGEATEALENGCVIVNNGFLTIRGGGAVTGGYNSGSGGAVNNTGALTVESGVFTNNKAKEAGAIYNASGASLTIKDGSFTDNEVTAHGGAVVNYGDMTVESGTFTGNTVPGNGGAIWNGAALTVTGGTFTNNVAGSRGGGIYVNGSAALTMEGGVTVADNTVSGNKDNVWLASGKTINVTDTLTGTVGVAMQNPGTFTSGLSGNGAAENFTSDDGVYAVTLTDEGEARLAEKAYWGDANCNGQVDMADAAFIMQCAANPDKYGLGKTSLSITQEGALRGDVDGKTGLSNGDALLIQKFVLGLYTPESNGTYQIPPRHEVSKIPEEDADNADVTLSFEAGGSNKCTVETGASVSVAACLKAGNVAVAGMDVIYQIESPLTITGFGGSAAAYNATVDKNEEKLELNFFAVGSDGEPVKGEVGEAVFKCMVSVPKDCPAGDYTVTFKAIEAYKSGQNSESWNVAVIPLAIRVREPVAAPAAPAEESKTATSVTLTKTDNYQYSKDGTSWQDSNIFDGLKADTEYTFYQRVAGDDSHNASPASSGTKIRTTQYTLVYAPGEEASGTMAPEGVSDNDTYKFPECGFQAPEYKTFSHWEMSGIDGVFFPNGETKIVSNCATPDGIITVTACWKFTASVAVTMAPGAKNLTYNGNAQELVTSGAAQNGTMNYAIGPDETTAPTAGWSESVPAATDAGTYYVWYKAAGDTSHADSDAACVTAEIGKRAVTLMSEGGAKPYDGSALTKPGVTVSGDGFVAGEVSDVKATGSVTTVAEGEVTNTITYTEGTNFKADNYTINKNEGRLKITPKAVTITADSAAKAYDGTALTKNSYTHTDLAEGDSVKSVTVTGSRTDAGTSENVPSAAKLVNAAGADVTSNYDVTYVNGTLKVTPAAAFTATGPDTGTLSNVTAGLSYAIDGGAAVGVTGTSVDLTGLKACAILVLMPGATAADSDAQTITVTKAATPNLAVTQPAVIDGTGSIATDATHELSEDGAVWTPCNGATAGLAADKTYYVRVKATGATLASEPQTVKIEKFEPEQEQTPAATFEAVGANAGTLAGLKAGMKYKVGSGEWQTASGASANLTGLAACTITLYMPGNGTTTIDSDEQTVSVYKAATPNLAVTQPAVIDGTGGIATDATHELSEDGAVWTPCNGATAGLAADKTYYVRVMATGATLASEPQTVKIEKFDPEQEQTPAATFEATGADTGTLGNLKSGMKYKVGSGAWQTASGASANLTGLAACTITLYMPGNGTTTVDSEEQSVTVTKAATPALEAVQPDSPYVRGRVETTSALEYSEDGTVWETCADGLTELTPEKSYYFRVKAAGATLASEPQEIRINAFPEPDAPEETLVTEISSGETVTAEQLEKLIEAGEPLTVTGANGAKLVLDTRALKTLAESGKAITITVETAPDGTTTVTAEADGKRVDGVQAKLELPAPAGGQALARVNEDGSETPVGKSLVEEGRALAVVTTGETVRVSDCAATYPDVKETAWYAGAVAFVTSHGLFEGTNRGFEPDATMTRAMMATVLYRLENAAASGKSPFADVPDGTWYTEAVIWANGAGVVEGTEKGFEPDEPVSREQIALMLWRYAKLLGLDVSARKGLDAFTDGDKTSAWAKEAMEWAVAVGLFEGNDRNELNPRDSASRAQVAAVLERFVKLILQ